MAELPDFDAPPKMSMDLFVDLGLDFEPATVAQQQKTTRTGPVFFVVVVVVVEIEVQGES